MGAVCKTAFSSTQARRNRKSKCLSNVEIEAIHVVPAPRNLVIETKKSDIQVQSLYRHIKGTSESSGLIQCHLI